MQLLVKTLLPVLLLASGVVAQSQGTRCVVCDKTLALKDLVLVIANPEVMGSLCSYRTTSGLGVLLNCHYNKKGELYASDTPECPASLPTASCTDTTCLGEKCQD
ncbi:hypothetical protein NEOLEDRAFT_1183734 [Neolentinus lepideus HHB14362 ss-1]|uniref:Uncharacterized protein n=1 Tax=Neolentinus lepideus HHB14362 ss-1 TaxID=1314782 RepID=A0A165N0S1_9AGAM|nr:hypothetical protein NEOLEDRAFT_1183734 [Neolentinus lepideus HHB14362 ss-1]